MVHSPRARSNEIVAAGALGQIAGAANLNGNVPFLIQSGNVNMETALTGGQGHYVAPFDLRIIGAQLTVVAQLGTGAATFAAGVVGDADAIIDDYSVAISVTAGTTVDLTADASFTAADKFGKIIAKGTVIYFSSDGGATTTGGAAAVLVAVPA